KTVARFDLHACDRGPRARRSAACGASAASLCGAAARLVLAASTLLCVPAFAQPAAQPPLCGPGADLLLVNGRIHTMDAEDRVVSSVHILSDTFAAVGRAPQPTACTETVDLGGRTVVPGIIDNHNHIVLLGLRPGHDTRLEDADSIDAVLDTLAAKAAEVPAGEWITSIGGFDINQFVPPRSEERRV